MRNETRPHGWIVFMLTYVVEPRDGMGVETVRPGSRRAFQRTIAALPVREALPRSYDNRAAVEPGSKVAVALGRPLATSAESPR